MRSKSLILFFSIALCVCIWFTGNGNFPVSSEEKEESFQKLVLESGIPVISVITSDHALPGDADSLGELTVYEIQDGKLRQTNALIEIRERGNTSRRFPKKSYRIKIVDEKKEKMNLSLLGLRSDDDWILNPMYTDTSKIREALAYGLWEKMNSSGNDAASTRVRYAEVFLNGEYWGLYGLQERVDRKQVNGDKRSSILYKIIANDRPEVEELLACENNEICRGFELQFSGASVQSSWEPAAAYMAYLNGVPSDIQAELSLQNTVDYGLWAMLCQAHDCHFKNQYLNCVYNGSGYTMYKIPWDLNNTFADVWKTDGKETNYTDYRIGKLVIDGAFGILLESGDEMVYTQIKSRWELLRNSLITEENLINMAHEIHMPLMKAIERDSMRWPECGMGNGNAANIRDIERYIREILPKMDEFIFGLEAQK